MSLLRRRTPDEVTAPAGAAIDAETLAIARLIVDDVAQREDTLLRLLQRHGAEIGSIRPAPIDAVQPAASRAKFLGEK